ncbi:MAG: 2-amino-4-hydroxy-6-hydroxymethyldihydropteridine diphosphokinase [Acidimicrobiales bacterium]
MRDQIRLDAIRVSGTIGVLAEEQVRSQPFEVDLVLEVDTSEAGSSDDLEHAVDYGAPIAITHRIVSTERHQLLERVCARIAEEVLSLDGVEAVEVTVRKLQVPVPQHVGSSAVRIRRERVPRHRRVPRWSVAYLALGTNLGDRRANLGQAIGRLGFEHHAGGLRISSLSGLYETDPIGGPDDQGPFLNMVVEVETTLDPFELLDRCLATEKAGGRTRSVRWGPRVIDVDVLLYGDVRIESPELTLPHPRMWERRFVLEPLADVAPQLLSKDWSDRLPAGGIERVSDLFP